MPDLFNYNLLKSNIQKHTIDGYEEKHNVILTWKKNLGVIQGVNEVELQSAFLKDIFGKVLGYKGITETDGQWDMRIEATTEVDATKPDGILGFYKKDSEITQVVIELKGPKISLDKKQKTTTGKDYGTPVDQAFSYTSKYDRCKWVIVSNMIEIRLYKVGRSQDYFESFYIEELDDEKEFNKFHLLLCKDSLISETGESTTSFLSERTKDHIQDISVEFYNIYRNTRIRLFEELKKNNPIFHPEVLLEKAQKFLDRMIFICFCEDLGLLPNDLLHHAINRGKESFSTSETVVWEEMKGIFLAIDKGSGKHNIPAYDGGLFEFDEVLDTLVIRNDFFDVIYKISDYDFNSDLDANILGHIFEQSISDIESLKADIQQNEYSVKHSRRKKEGIYYTPRYITKYIVENSLGKYLEDIRKELGEDNLPDMESASTPQMEGRYRNQYLKFYREYEERVKKVKVLDPACGSGAFLNQTFEFLLNEYRWIHEQISHLHGEQITIFHQGKYYKNVLQNNLYGVDLNEESVEITKLSLWLKTANRNEPLAYLDNNIKCGNSLIDDPEVAGYKAFNWEEEFPEIMNSGGFDIVIGNPPYVRQEQLQEIKDYLSSKYEVFNNSADIYCYFMEKGIGLLKRNGYFSCIVSSKFTRTKYGKHLRELLLTYCIIEYVDFKNEEVFSEATVDPCTITIYKVTPPTNNLIKYNHNQSIYQKNLNRLVWTFISDADHNLMEKIKIKGKELKKWNNIIKRGILSGFNKAFVIDKTIRDELVTKDSENQKLIQPTLRGRDLERYGYNFKELWIIFTRRGINIDNYPTIKEYLKKYYEHLKPKNSTTDKIGRKSGNYNWFEIQDSIEYYSDFEKEKILWPEISDKPRFVIDDVMHFYPLKTVFIMTGDHLRYLLPILNSTLIEWYFDNISTSTGVGTNMWSKYKVEQLPIPNTNNKDLFIDRADIVLKGKEQQKKLGKVSFVKIVEKIASKRGYSLANVVNKSQFSNHIYSERGQKVRNLTVSLEDTIITIYSNKSGTGKYELIKFQVKDCYRRQYIKLFLEKLTEEMLEEINNYNGNILERVLQIKIPDYDKDHVVRKVVTEWKNHQREIVDLGKKIEETDKEMDEMVYELYGLTEDEIKIVEEGNQES